MLRTLLHRIMRCANLLAAVIVSCASIASAATFNPANSSAFTTALQQCALGDTIILNASTSYTAPSGGFVLPNKGSGTAYITITTSSLSSLPPAGQRVFPSHAGHMPNIYSPGANSAAIQAAPGSHHYKLVGLEIIGPANDSVIQGGLVMLGTTGTDQDTQAEIPHHINIERCYIHDNSPAQNLRRAVVLHTDYSDVVDSYISGCKDNATDSQAIAGSNGTGHYNIINNYLEAGAENVMFGGMESTVPNLVPADILISRNHMTKPDSWRNSPYGWWVKNLFELKCGKRVTVDGNILENCWAHAQNQHGVGLNLKSETDWSVSWHTTEDIVFQNNIVRNVGQGFQLSADYDPQNGFGLIRNLTIRNNLWYNIDNTWPDNTGWWFTVGIHNGEPYNITIDHNTVFQPGSICNLGPDPSLDSTGFVYTNNLVTQGSGYGFKGDSTGDGESTLDGYFPGATYLKNVVVGSNINNYLPNYPGGWNPTGLAAPASWSGVLVNQANPGTDFAGWKVVTGSAYDNAGTDGKDIGADIDAILTATAGCISGVWSGSPPPGGGGSTTITLKNGVNGYTGASSFRVSGENPTVHYGANSYHHVANYFSGTNFWLHRPFYKFDLTQGANAIPSGATIQSASLKVKVEFSGGGTAGIKLYRVKPVNNAFTVNYTTATRNTYNGSNSWTGGGNAAGNVADSNNDYVDTPAATGTLPADGQFLTLDVTSSVQAWANGEANNGWLFMPDDRTVYLGTTSDLHGSADYPELTVTYSSAPTTITLKNGVNGYNGAISFGVSGETPTAHYGPASYHHVLNNWGGTNFYMHRPFYKFDVSQAASGIPSGATITSASLKLRVTYSNDPTDRTIRLHRVSPVNGAFTVNYATATRNTYNGSNSWTGGANAGGDVANSNNDFLDTPDGTAQLPAGGLGTMTFNVTSSVQAWVNGTANNGWLLLTSPDATTVYLGTSGDLNGSVDYPELTVDYQ